MTAAVMVPDPARRRQLYAEAAVLLQTCIEDLTALEASTARLVACLADATRESVKLPLDGCVDLTLAARLVQCHKTVKRLARLAAVGV